MYSCTCVGVHRTWGRKNAGTSSVLATICCICLITKMCCLFRESGEEKPKKTNKHTRWDIFHVSFFSLTAAVQTDVQVVQFEYATYANGKIAILFHSMLPLLPSLTTQTYQHFLFHIQSDPHLIFTNIFRYVPNTHCVMYTRFTSPTMIRTSSSFACKRSDWKRKYDEGMRRSLSPSIKCSSFHDFFSFFERLWRDAGRNYNHVFILYNIQSPPKTGFWLRTWYMYIYKYK